MESNEQVTVILEMSALEAITSCTCHSVVTIMPAHRTLCFVVESEVIVKSHRFIFCFRFLHPNSGSCFCTEAVRGGVLIVVWLLLLSNSSRPALKAGKVGYV